MHPDNNKIKVFINGRSKGSKVLIPSGGHTPPTGKRDEAKKRSLITKKFSPHWEEEAKSMLIHGTNSWTYTWASPVLSLTKLKFPMIKKKKDRLFEASRSIIVKAYEEGRLPNLDLTIFSEISKAVEKKI